MNRDSEAKLLDFCACQKGAFQEQAWLETPLIDKNEMGVVCLFLAGLDWYGHQQSLSRVAERLLGSSDVKLDALVSSLRFDCLRFSTMLKRRLSYA